MDRKSRNIAWFLMVLFAMFFCGNTFFIHTHRSFDGDVEVHSHPYMPGAGHSHTAAGFQAIAHINAALATFDKSPETDIPHVLERRINVIFRVRTSEKAFYADLRKERAPPVAA
ncbi:MAG: hypothetical protein K2I39_01250 [Muribaculaceae bacterium]|nr:hypothetical protein [Muribaculaceae bacterium]